MSKVVLLDTTILLNYIEYPGKSDQREMVMERLDELAGESADLLIPWLAIYETAGHIVRHADGGQRRALAVKLTNIVTCAIQGEAPWVIMDGISKRDLGVLFDGFPDRAISSISLVDHSIILDYEKTCQQSPRAYVEIWSLDHHLAGYNRDPLTR